MKKKYLLNKWCGTEYVNTKKKNKETYLNPYININSKWIADMNVNAKNIKTSIKMHERKICGLVRDFLDKREKA